MKHYIVIVVFSLTILVSCGTTKGILDGVGSVLEGLSYDVRSVGSILE
jgi:hypothetical protein